MRIRAVNVAAAVAMQAGVVPMIMGDPGSCKTGVFKTLADQLKVRFMSTILRQRMPEDIGGMPVQQMVTMADGISYPGVVYVLPEDILRAVHEPTLWVLDEFNQCGHDVMGAAQEVINNPPKTCYMVAIGNPIERSTDGKELPPPVINRMCLLQWERPVEARRAGWRNGFKNYPSMEFPILPEGWQDELGPTYGNLMCDIEDRLPHLFGEAAYPKDMDKATQPWPSDRSMTAVGRLLAACDSVGASASVRAQLVYGCIGEAAGNEVLQYIGYKDLPDPEEWLARPDQIELPKRFDLSRACIASVMHAVEADNTGDRWERLYDVLEEVYNQQPEVAMSAEGAMWKIKPEGWLPKKRVGAAVEMREARVSKLQTA